MKIRIIASVFLTFIFLISAAQDAIKRDKIVIYGELDNIPYKIEYLYALCINCNKGGYDTIKVVNNKYKYVLYSNGPAQITLYSKPMQEPDAFFEKNMATIVVFGTNVRIKSKKIFSNFIVKNAPVTTNYLKLMQINNSDSAFLAGLYSQKFNYIKENNIDRANIIQNKIDSVWKQRGEKYLHFAKKNKNSLIVPYVLYKLLQDSHNDKRHLIKALHANLNLKQKETDFAKVVGKILQVKRVALNETATAFSLSDTLKRTVTLSDFKGKYVLLEFWASWCTPCIAEIPYLKSAYKKYKDVGFEIVSISINKSNEFQAWTKAINEQAINWINLIDEEGEVRKKYGVEGIPRNFLINPEGKIIQMDLRNIMLESVLSKIFSKK